MLSSVKSNPVKYVALSLLTLALASCGQRAVVPAPAASSAALSSQRLLPVPGDPGAPIDPGPVDPGPIDPSGAVPSTRKGMTWHLVSQSGDVARVGYDAATNAYQGDTSVLESRPVLCIRQDGRAAPDGLALNGDGWAGGEVKLSPSVPGTALTSLTTANALCSGEFGDGWRMAEFHDAPSGWRWYVNASTPIDPNTRFWVSINDQPANPWDSAGTPEDVVVPTTTKVADADTRAALLLASPDESQLVFAHTTPRLDSLQPGDILTSLPTPAAPGGFLRRVLNVSRQGDQVVVGTEPGSLEDAVQDANIDYEASLDFGENDLQLAPGVTFQDNSGPGLRTQSLFHKRFTLNQVKLFDCPSPSNGKATLDGFIDLELKAFLHAKIKWFSLKQIEAGVNAQENSELKLDAQCDYSASVGPVQIATLSGSPSVFFVGPVPVVARPLVVISVGANGKVSATLHLKVQHDASLKLGAKWEKGAGLSVINEHSNNLRFDVPSAQVDVSAKAYAKVRAGILFYEAGYVYGYGSPFLDFTASTAATPPCKLDGGMEYGVGASLRIFGKDLGKKDWQLGEFRKTLWTGCASGSASHAGMTWTVLGQRGNQVIVGADAASNVYQGDTPASATLPVLCLYVDGRPVPAGITPDFYHGWAEGAVNFTAPVSGTRLTSRAAADTLCATTFGAGWRMGEFHDGKANGAPGGWRFWADGAAPPSTSRFWAAINDQAANPWN